MSKKDSFSGDLVSAALPSREAIHLLLQRKGQGLWKMGLNLEPWHLDPLSAQILSGQAVEQVWTRKKISQILGPTLAEELRRRVKENGDGEKWTWIFKHQLRPGAIRYVRLEGMRIRGADKKVEVIGVVEDFTSQWLSEEAERLSKVRLVDTLAGGIAHSMNNILAAISGFSELISRHLKGDFPAIKLYFDGMQTANERARRLIRQMQTIARRDCGRKEPINFSRHLLEGLEEWAARERVDFPWIWTEMADGVTIQADSGHLRQVIGHLMDNARQAQGEAREPIQLRLFVLRVDREHPVLGLDQEGEYVCWSVEDFGEGIPAYLQKRVFDPFYTTRPVDEGIGLGLAVVEGIMQSHGGVVQLESTVGKGTVVRTYWPLWESPQRVDQEPGTADGFIAGRIMVVDDEDFILMITKTILEEEGFAVTTFFSAEKALAELNESAPTYDVILCDETMPGMDGREFFLTLEKQGREIPFVFVTGNNPEALRQEMRNYPRCQVLGKPTETAELLKAIRGVCQKQ